MVIFFSIFLRVLFISNQQFCDGSNRSTRKYSVGLPRMSPVMAHPQSPPAPPRPISSCPFPFVFVLVPVPGAGAGKKGERQAWLGCPVRVPLLVLFSSVCLDISKPLFSLSLSSFFPQPRSFFLLKTEFYLTLDIP